MEYRNRMVLEILSLPENVGLARVAVASFAAQLDFSWGEIEEIKVATSEAVSNAVIHAYPGVQGTIRITATLRDRELDMVVEDQGRGIGDVEKAKEPSFSTQPDRMGLGFVFMDSFMDLLEVDSAIGRGTRVRMVKRCRGASP